MVNATMEKPANGFQTLLDEKMKNPTLTCAFCNIEDALLSANSLINSDCSDPYCLKCDLFRYVHYVITNSIHVNSKVSFMHRCISKYLITFQKSVCMH